MERLTDREREVLALVARHFTTGEIAARLGLAEATVRTHIEHILAKLGVRSRREAARLWVEIDGGEAASPEAEG